MLVPTMALAWWLASLPARSLPMWGDAPPRRAAAASVWGPDGPTLPRDDEPGSAEPAPASVSDVPLPEKRVLVRSVLLPEMIRTAQDFLDLPLGSERAVAMDGHRYVFVLEPHYHPPGFVGAPTGWHKGVTIYELVSSR